MKFYWTDFDRKFKLRLSSFVRFLVFVFFLLSSKWVKGQNEWFTPTGKDFIIGLDNIEYLRKKLIESHLTLVNGGKIEGLKGTIYGTFENWEWNATLTVEFQTIFENNFKMINVVVNRVNTCIPERLLSDITILFPIQQIEEHIDTAILNGELFHYATGYFHNYSRPTDNIKVKVIYSENEYYFKFQKE